MAAPSARRRSERLEVRTTPEERALIDRAVSAAGTDLTDFVVANLTIAAQRVLADRTEFASTRKPMRHGKPSIDVGLATSQVCAR